MKKTVVVAAIALLTLALSSVKSEASLILSGTIGGVDFCATDNNSVCSFGVQLTDTNGTAGVISLAPTLIGGVDVEGSLHTATNGSLDVLSSSSLSIMNTTGSSITYTTAVSSTGFAGPIILPGISTTGSGSFVNAQGSTTTFSYYADATNQQGAENPTDTPGILVDTFSASATLPVDSFSHNGGPFPDLLGADPYSMTITFNGTLVAGGALISRGQSEIVTTAAPVPEPASLFLLGTGLLFGVNRIRKNKLARLTA